EGGGGGENGGGEARGGGHLGCHPADNFGAAGVRHILLGDNRHPRAAQGRRQTKTRNSSTAMMTASSKPASGTKITNAPSTSRKRSIARAAITSATIAKPNGPTLAT